MSKRDPLSEKRRILEAYKSVFSSANGKLVLEDLHHTYSLRSCFVVGQPDTSAFREGQRSIAVKIDRILTNPIDELMGLLNQGEADHEPT